MLSLPFYLSLFWQAIKDKISSLNAKRKRHALNSVIIVILLVLMLTRGVPAYQALISPLSSSAYFTLPNGEEIVMPDLQGMSKKDMRFKSYIIEKANIFMAQSPDLPERAKNEVAMLEFLTKNNASAADILLALQATVTKPARVWAMEYLWELRQRGKLTQFNIFPLSQKATAWAKERNIDPRILAIATDVYGPTLKLLEAQPEIFFEAAKGRSISNIQKYIPNPAVVAKLQMMETGWHFDDTLNELVSMTVKWDFSKNNKEDRAFVNIGGVNAWDALNLSDEWFPSGQKDLLWIAQDLQNSTGLPYKENVRKLPGSVRGWGDGSGGAIGPQLMPLNARLFMGWYKEANQKTGNVLPNPNPFNPWTGTMLAYLYLSSEFYHRQLDINDITDVVRPGYAVLEDRNSNVLYDPKADPRMKALLKWNPLYWEAKAAVVAGEEYATIWYSKNLYAFNINNE